MRPLLDIWLAVQVTIEANTHMHRKVLRMNDTTGTSVSNSFGLGGGFGTVMYGWLTNGETAIFIGILVTIAGFFMSFYFQRRRHIRERTEHLARQEFRKREEERKEEIHQEIIRQYKEKDHEQP